MDINKCIEMCKNATMPEGIKVSGNTIIEAKLKHDSKRVLAIPEGIEEIADKAFNTTGKIIILPTSIKKIGRSAIGEFNHIIILSKSFSCSGSILATNVSTRYITAHSEGEYKTIFVPTNISVPRRGRAKSSIKISKKEGLTVDLEKYMAVDQMGLSDKFMRAFYATRYFDADAHEDIRRCLKYGVDYAFKNSEIDIDDFKALNDMGDITKTNITYLKKYALAYEQDDIYDYLCSVKPKT